MKLGASTLAIVATCVGLAYSAWDRGNVVYNHFAKASEVASLRAYVDQQFAAVERTTKQHRLSRLSWQERRIRKDLAISRDDAAKNVLERRLEEISDEIAMLKRELGL